MGRHSRRGRAADEVRSPAADPVHGPAARYPEATPQTRPRTPGEGRPASPWVARPGDGPSTPAHGTALDAAGQRPARGDHPQDEPARPAVGGMVAGTAPRPGPRQEYLDAFDDDVFAAGAPGRHDTRREDAAGPPVTAGPVRSGTAAPGRGEPPAETAEQQPPLPPDAAATGRRRGSRARAFTGSMAAAVTTVLAVVIAGQVTGGTNGTKKAGGTAAAHTRNPHGGTGEAPPKESASPSPPSFEEAMSRVYPLKVGLHGPGTFHTVGGHAEGPGGGTELTYRVDVEDGLPLDGDLFAEAVQRTVNDDRGWAHGRRYSFDRVSSGDVDFVITLASPGTTGVWCAKSGLDTTIQHVSCDSASTPRVMINGWRWAQGSETFGDERIFGYRQMLINHEIGHRLGHDHRTCPADGALAPVMMQQTKSLATGTRTCRPNPWPYPRS